MPAIATTHPQCVLEPMDLHDQAQFEELLRQRKICGWKDTPHYITAWQKGMEAGTKYLFWIKPVSQLHVRAGHISLDNEYEPPFLEVGDKTILRIASLFVLPEHRGGGIGRAAVETVESWAVTEPYGSKDCKALVIDAVSRNYSEDDEWRAEYLRITGIEANPRGASNEDWYARMGYVKYREEPVYPGSDPSAKGDLLWASFLRKEIQ